jgi:hypothetical protein
LQDRFPGQVSGKAIVEIDPADESAEVGVERLDPVLI